MLAKCANPECSTRFQYFREGKLFLVEVGAAASAGPAGNGSVPRKPQRKVEHFWLCGRCIQTMTLAVEPGRGVVAVPRSAPPRRAEAG